jgi:hypothetical protein
MRAPVALMEAGNAKVIFQAIPHMAGKVVVCSIPKRCPGETRLSFSAIFDLPLCSKHRCFQAHGRRLFVCRVTRTPVAHQGSQELQHARGRKSKNFLRYCDQSGVGRPRVSGVSTCLPQALLVG